MELSLWCSGVYSALLTAFCFTNTMAPAISTTQNTQANTVLSGIVSGSYAAETAVHVLEEIPVVNILPIEIFDLEEEFTEFIQKESSRHARHFVHDHVNHLGLSGSLSLNSPPPASNRSYSGSASGRRRTRLRAKISSRRLGLSLIFRF